MLHSALFYFALLLLLLYMYFAKKNNYWKDRRVDHIKPVPFFGNMLSMIFWKEAMGKEFANLCARFDAPYVGFYFFTSPALIVSDPAIVRSILIKNFDCFTDRLKVAEEKVDPILSNSLFGIKGSPWRALRTRLSPVFTSGKLKLMCKLMISCGENLEKYLDEKVNVALEAKEMAAKYTTDVITSCAFGFDGNSFESEDSVFRVIGRQLFQRNILGTLQAVSYFVTPNVVKLLKYPFMEPNAVAFLREVFTETLKQREEKKIKRNDLIDILIELKNQETSEEQFKFYGDRLVAQAVVFFGAGHETTSSTIAFALYELSVHQHIQDRLRDEINEVIKTHGGLTYEAIQDMKYLDMVISETLRKYPLTPFIQRICTKTCTLSETGLVVDKGLMVFIPQYALHGNPKYFPEPEKFDPERFNEENKPNILPYTYLPFGEGPRVCIGERFAQITTKIGITSILRKFCVERDAKTTVPLKFNKLGLLVVKGGIQLIFKKI